MENNFWAPENNQVHLIGTIMPDPVYSHNYRGENFYRANIEIIRWSGAADIIPAVISDRLLDEGVDYAGKTVEIFGQYRSRTLFLEEKNKLELFVFVKEMNLADVDYHDNKINLNGFLCKTPIYRVTPKGRYIADMMLAVNRAYGKSDYIPCIVWGRNAKYVSKLNLGTHLKIEGRIQSREYQKQVGEEYETRTAYEVSVSSIEPVEEENLPAS